MYLRPRSPKLSLYSSNRGSRTNDIDLRTPSGVESSSTGNASSKRHFRTYEEAQSLVYSETDHATQEVADIGDNDGPLRDIPLPTSLQVPATSTQSLVTSYTLNSSAILGQRAIPLASIVDPL
ncbi:hypothetical protein GH714_015742 [Hevea brasiliensis]|uniref:Uncharacterized protein n=1 Tax=Hevea brasiliensis TaxID=3981 RepID=A0A6A6L205_HEVBR|nr:hypothetical protein GH714_015742 [Hevea brasiliensis]